jgi:phage shock protein A
MTLRLIDRITTLLRADAHGVVGSLEERSLLLEQSLRDAELDLVDKRARLETLAADEERVQQRAERCTTQLAALDEDVALALAGEREELARFAIRRLLPLRREVASLEHEGAALAASRTALAERLAEQELEFEDLRARVRVRLAQRSRVDRSDEFAAMPAAAGPVDEAEVELELLRRRGAAHAEATR